MALNRSMIPLGSCTMKLNATTEMLPLSWPAFADARAIAEELGRVVAPIPFASTVYFVAEARMLAGSEAQKQAWLPKIAAGEVIGAFATSERPGAPTEASIQAQVQNGRLTGTKLPVTDGDIATLSVVLAKDGGRLGLYLVDLTGQGVARETLQTLDPTRGVAKLTFNGASAERLGEAGEGHALAEAVLSRAAVLLAFDRALEMAKDYALNRYAFGRPIGSYQAIKHKLADMYVKNELARSNAYYGAWALDTGASELPLAAAAARVSACDAYWYAAKENLQTHGGIGYTWEMDCHLFYRRAQQLGLVAGAAKAWKERRPQSRRAEHEAVEGLAGQEGRGRLFLHNLAEGMGRRRRPRLAGADLQSGRG